MLLSYRLTRNLKKSLPWQGIFSFSRYSFARNRLFAILSDDMDEGPFDEAPGKAGHLFHLEVYLS